MGRFIKKCISVFLVVSLIVALMPNIGNVNNVKAANTADEVVNIAISQEGYIEKASNYLLDDKTANAGNKNFTKYHRDLGIGFKGTGEQAAWCAYFTRWVLQTAGVPSSEFPESGSVPDWQEFFINKGRYHERGTYIAKPGDLVIIRTSQGPRGHIGIVVLADDVGFFYTSGNTGNNTDRVARSSWISQNDSQVTGWCEMSYNQSHPEGFVDSIVSEFPGTIKVTGWTYDPGNPTKSIRAYICVGGDAGDSNAECYAIESNVYREDVDKALHIGGYHGFEKTIKVNKYGNQVIHVYGLADDGRYNKLNGSGKSINIIPGDQSPVGWFDGAVSNASGTISITGWAYDPDSPASALDVKVYIGGKPGDSGVEEYTVCANKYSGYVDENTSAGGYHAFIETIKTNKVGNQPVYVYAMDATQTNSSTDLASNTDKTVSIIPYHSFAMIWDGHWYKRFDSGCNWKEAVSIANKLGGHLVTVESASEQEALEYLISDGWEDFYWLGASDEITEGQFKWINDSPFNYNNFGEGRPDNTSGIENYLSIYRNTGKWDDLREDYQNYGKVGFIVEYDTAEKEVTGEFNNHNYKVINNSVTAEEARNMQGDGWYLATVTSKEENDFINDLILQFNNRNGAYWIGGKYNQSTGNYVWDDGESFAYSNWDDSQPSTNGYITINTYGAKWNSEKSSNYRGYVLEKDNHTQHHWDSGTVTKAATCTENGIIKYACTDQGCSETKELPIKASGHNLVAHLEKEATCNTAGNNAYWSCDICNKYFSDLEATNEIEENAWIIKAKNHVFDQWNVDNAYLKTAADCTHSTIYYKSCKCGEVGTETFEYGEPLGHDWDEGKVTKEPTHYESGIKTYTCDNCGETWSEEISKIESDEHVYDQEIVDAIYLKTAADCTHSAIYYKSCVCGEAGTETFEYGEPLGHKWDEGKVTKEPTETEKGIKTFTCSVCNETKTEDIPVISKQEEKTIEITLDGNGVNLLNSKTIADSSGHIKLPTISREGYKLKGWFTDKNGGEKINESTIFTNSITIYAIWEKESESDGSFEVPPTPTTPTPTPIVEPDKQQEVDGVGTISADGKTLTDTDGDKYLVAEKITSDNLVKNAAVADKGSAGKYKITKVTKKKGKITGGTVTYMKPYNKNSSSAVVKDTVKLGGVKFKITVIANNAFKGSKIKKLTIGKNITKIGKNAANGCTDLKDIKIKTKVLKKIGSKAFYGINAKAKFKVSAKNKVKKYKKMIKKAGAPKKAKYK